MSECKKLQSLIQNVVNRRATFISQREYDNVRIECGNIVKEYVIAKDTGVIVDEVRNVYANKTVPNPVIKKVQ